MLYDYLSLMGYEKLFSAIKYGCYGHALRDYYTTMILPSCNNLQIGIPRSVCFVHLSIVYEDSEAL